MATMPKVAESGGLDSILSMLSNANTLFGSGRTKTNESGGVTTSSLSPETSGQSNDLLSKILSDSSGGTIDDVISNIFYNARAAMGPNLMASIGAGNRAYSDTTLAQVQANAVARATQEAASAKLQAINAGNATATNLVNAKMNATRSVANPATTKVSSTGASPTGQVLAAALLARQGYKLGSGVLKQPGVTGTPTYGGEEFDSALQNAYSSQDIGATGGDYFNNDLSMDAFGPGGTDASAVTSSIPGVFSEEEAAVLNSMFSADNAQTGAAGDTLTNAAALSATDVASGISPFSTGVSSTGGLPDTFAVTRPTSSPFQQQAGETPIYDESGNVIGWSAADAGATGSDMLAGDTAGDVLTSDALDSSASFAASEEAGSATANAAMDAASSGFSDILPAYGIFNMLSEGGMDEGVGETAQLAGDIGKDTWDIVSNPVEAIGRMSIICTELYNQKKLSKRYYVPSARIFQTYSDQDKKGYYIWATPVVKFIRENPDSTLTKVVSHIFNIRNKYIATGKGISGYLVERTMYWFCIALSRMIPNG